MTAFIEKRKTLIVNVFYFALIAGIAYIAGKTLMPLLMPFIFAFITAGIINRPIKAISTKTPLKRSLLSVIFVLFMVAVLALIFFLVGMELIKKMKDFGGFLGAKLQNMDVFMNDVKLWILNVTSFLPESIKTVLHENVTIFCDNIAKNGFGGLNIDTSSIDWGTVISKGGEVLSKTVAKIPSFIIAFVVYLISTVFISSDYEKIKRFFVKQLKPETADKVSYAWKLGTSSLKKMFKAYALIILITTTELTVGFYILSFLKIFNNPFIILIAFGIALIDIIPVLGTGTVLLPWAVISFVLGNIKMGIGLLVMYVIIFVIRQIIEPKLVAGQVGLPPIATIIAMYIGSKTLGILGFFILPFIVILLKVYNDEGIIHLFRDPHSGEYYEKKAEADATEAEADAVSDSAVMTEVKESP